MQFPRRFAATVAVLGLAATGIWYATRWQPPPVLVHTVARGLVEATVAPTAAFACCAALYFAISALTAASYALFLQNAGPLAATVFIAFHGADERL